MRYLKLVASVAGIGLLALLTFGAFSVRAAEQQDIAAMIANAKTSADHEAIASYYDQQASEAKKQAEMHRQMAKSYTVGSSIGKGSLTPAPQHCAALAKDYDSAAQEYATLAAAHRSMAKAAK